MFPVPSSLKASTWVKNEMIGSSLWFWFNVDLFCSHYCAGRSLKLLIALPLPWCRFSRVRWRLAPEPNQPQLRQKRVEVGECFSLSLSELCQENASLIFVKRNQPQLRKKRIQLRCRELARFWFWYRWELSPQKRQFSSIPFYVSQWKARMTDFSQNS